MELTRQQREMLAVAKREAGWAVENAVRVAFETGHTREELIHIIDIIGGQVAKANENWEAAWWNKRKASGED
jgi:hypothetical protein